MQVNWTPTQIDIFFKIFNLAVVPFGIWAVKHLIKTSRELINGIIEKNCEVVKLELVHFIDERFKEHDKCDQAIIVRLINLEALIAAVAIHKVELVKT